MISRSPTNRPVSELWSCALLVLLLLITSAILSAPSAQAQIAQSPDFVRVTPLTPLDRQYMGRQRQQIDELARRRLGRSCCNSVDNLPLLQRLLDEQVVLNDQPTQLQAMGIVLGDILAGELGLDWVIYEDRRGRSRALRLGDTDNYLFPATMISRRRQADNDETVQAIYDGAYAAMEPLLPPLPFQ